MNLTHVPVWLTAIVVLLGLVGTVASAFAVTRYAALKASLDTFAQTNDELRKANADLRKELQDERLERSKLEGKLEVFTQHFAQQLIDVVVKTLRPSGGE